MRTQTITSPSQCIESGDEFHLGGYLFRVVSIEGTTLISERVIFPTIIGVHHLTPNEIETVTHHLNDKIERILPQRIHPIYGKLSPIVVNDGHWRATFNRYGFQKEVDFDRLAERYIEDVLRKSDAIQTEQS